MKKYLFAVSSFLLLFFLSACVTTKKSKEETGFIGRKYHDLTAKFNGYFNAGELYNASILQLEESHIDNYNQLLVIYPHEGPEDRSAIEADMDKAIEKVTKVAALHEPSKWVDDCYVLLGKAQYLKGDYESAQETFEYFIDDFNPRDPDSRVYQSPDRKESVKQRRQEEERERKIQEDQRKKEQEQKEKTRKQKEKERKKERKQREKERKQRQKDRKRGVRTTRTTEVAETPPQPEEEVTPPAGDVVSTVENIPVDPDEEYIRQLEQENNKSRVTELKTNTGGFLKHRPAYYEGMLWLVKSYIARQKWLDANYFLEKLEKDVGVQKSVMREVPLVRADLLIKQKNYRGAVTALEAALDGDINRKQKARLAFIIAQLHQQNGNAEAAYAAFERVNDFRPGYEMSLNAKLNQLRNSWTVGDQSGDAAIRQLEKMAKEDKNISYLGSIYFTMAEIRLAEGKEDEAFEYFNLALTSSGGEANKGDIYYRLANLFFGREEYVDAKLYFDSTLTAMAKSDERFVLAGRLSRNLTEIARNIRLIESKDSLIALANLPTDELRALARKEAEKKLNEQLTKEKEESGGFTATTTVLSGNSKFFAYNQIALQRGRQDFLKRWGDRALEDDWRRSNKTSSLIDTEEPIESIPTISEDDLAKEMEHFLRDIPKTEEAKQDVYNSLENALYKLGTGFRTYLDNFENSNETLLELLDRFPKTLHRVESYFFLYLNYLDLGQPAIAQSYYDRIQSEFPDSDYAKYLRDPSGENVLMTQERKIQLYYQKTYDYFKQGQFQEAADRLDQALELFGKDHKMVPKYDLLSAMCIGQLQGQEQYINALKGVIIRHTNTPEQTLAREMLRFLKGDDEAFGGNIPDEELENFVLEDEKLHYIIVIVFDADGPDVNEIKNQINQYNENYHSGDRLRSSSVYLNQEKKTHLILIRRFQDRTKSMAYFRQTVEKADEFIDSARFSYEAFAINQKNYREVIKAKSVAPYRVFFEKNYL